MILLGLGIIALAVAIPVTAAILRGTILGYEDRRITWARERWDERVEKAVASVEKEAERLKACELEIISLEKRVSSIQTAAGFRPSRLRGT